MSRSMLSGCAFSVVAIFGMTSFASGYAGHTGNRRDARVRVFNAQVEGVGQYCVSAESVIAHNGSPAFTLRTSAAFLDWSPYWKQGYETAFDLPGNYSGRRKQVWQEFFQQLVAEHPNARVLDVGTGNLAIPRIAKEVAPGFGLYGIDLADIDPRKIEGSEGIVFFRLSAENLRPTGETSGFSDAELDAVTGAYALEYTDVTRSLPELRRVLRPGGRVMLVLHHPTSEVVSRARGLLEGVAKFDLGQLFIDLRDFVKNPKENKASKLLALLGHYQLAELMQPVIPVLFLRDLRVAKVKTPDLRAETVTVIRKHKQWLEETINKSRMLVAAADYVGDDAKSLGDTIASYGFDVESPRVLTDEKGINVGWLVKARKPDGVHGGVVRSEPTP